MAYLSVERAIELAATIRKAVDYPANPDDKVEAHTDGMAEFISHALGKPYYQVRAKIVDTALQDPRTGLEASKDLAKRTVT